MSGIKIESKIKDAGNEENFMETTRGKWDCNNGRTLAYSKICQFNLHTNKIFGYCTKRQLE